MIELSAGATSVVAHGIHYGVVGVGLAGLVALLGPQLVGGRRASIRDEHDLRVLALTVQISAGRLGVRATPSRPASVPWSEAVDDVRALYLPLAVVSSAAAAGVHAAVGPAHFREGVLLGMFFASAALAQVGWALAMAVRPSRPLLVAAVAGNSAVLLLWLVTRTIGLPGVLPGPEALGTWDVLCGVWELTVVLAAVHILRADAGARLRLPAWPDWSSSARAWAIGSALVLPAVSLLGIGA